MTSSVRTGTLVRRLLAEARPSWASLVGTAVIGMLAVPLVLLSPLPLKIAVDSGLDGRPLPGLLGALPAWFHTPSGVLVVAGTLQVTVVLLLQLQSLAVAALSTSTGERLTLAFRARIFGQAQRLSLPYHDGRGTADSVYRVQHDAPCIREILVDGLIPLGSSVLAVGGMILVCFRIDPLLAGVALGVAPFLLLSAWSYRRWTHRRYRDARGLESTALAVVQEVLTSLRVVRAFGREERERDRFVDRASAGARARVRLVVLEGVFALVVNLITAVGTALVLVLGIQRVRSGALTLGALLMIVAYLGQLYTPLKTVSKKVADLQTSLAGAERAFEVLDQVPDVPEHPRARALTRARGHIEFRDVTFGYRPGRPVLDRVSFTVQAGGRLCLVGRSGEGKTTLLSLLARFFDPSSGAIVLDGVDLRDYALADLRNQFAFVLQEPVLFSTTIAENIAYGRPDAGPEEIEAAARAAGAHGFIRRLPEGYDTQVGERGMRLSGGQRQRITVARAFLKDAPILILDEPTASVDLRTERAIVQSLERLMKGRTTILVTTRSDVARGFPSTIRLARGRIFPPARSSTARPSGNGPGRGTGERSTRSGERRSQPVGSRAAR